VRRSEANRGNPALALLCAALVAPLACGRKTPVKPPELVQPRAIRELAAENVAGGVRLSWERPREYVDGSTMRDLAGFRIERREDEGDFTTLVTVPVIDRDRFRQVRRFRFVDGDVAPGHRYAYRVFSFTEDHYVSQPSNLVEILREMPTAAPPAP
jgi:hypothetical protein